MLLGLRSFQAGDKRGNPEWHSDGKLMWRVCFCWSLFYYLSQKLYILEFIGAKRSNLETKLYQHCSSGSQSQGKGGYFVLRKLVTGRTATRQNHQVQKATGRRMASARSPVLLVCKQHTGQALGSGSLQSEGPERPCCGISCFHVADPESEYPTKEQGVPS